MNRCLFIISALALIASTHASCTQDRIGDTTGFPVPLQPVEVPSGEYYYNWKNPCGSTAPHLVGAEASMCSTVTYESPLVELSSRTQVTVSSSYGGLVNVIVFCGIEMPKGR